MYIFNYSKQEIRSAATLAVGIAMGFRSFGHYLVDIPDDSFCGEIKVYKKDKLFGVYTTTLEACLVMLTGGARVNQKCVNH